MKKKLNSMPSRKISLTIKSGQARKAQRKTDSNKNKVHASNKPKKSKKMEPSQSPLSLKDKFKKTIVLIPTYNEKDNIKELLSVLRRLYPPIMIMVIDDSSPDGTADLVKQIIRKGKDKKVFLLEKGTKEGIGKAYIRGFRKVLEMAKRTPIDYVVQMDADFSHDPVYLSKLLQKIDDNDLVIGSRYSQGVNVVNWPMRRILLSFFANQYVNFITRLNIHDVTGGFKVFQREALEKIDFDNVVSNGYVFQIEMNYILKKLGFKVAEVSIVFQDRQRGSSKINFNIIREAMVKVLFFPWKNLNHYKKKI